MNNSFGNIVNRKDNILNGFESPFEKGIEFIKTEKDIYDNINSVILKLRKLQNMNLAVRKEIQTALGYKPSQLKIAYIGSDPLTDENINREYSIYKTDNDNSNSLCNNEVPKTTTYIDNTDIRKTKFNDDEYDRMKKQYNNLSDKFFQIERRINYLSRLKSNLKKNSNRKIKLSDYDLREYGF